MFLLLPNTLFDTKYLKKDFTYVLYEHPLFFSSKSRVDTFHIQKLVFHRASMMLYHEMLLSKNFKVKYVEYGVHELNITHMFRPCDKLLENEFKHVEFVDSPMWLHTEDDLKDYKGGLRHHSFKLWSGRKLELDEALLKSQDTENRKKLPVDLKVPEMKLYKNRQIISESIKYITNLGIKTYGEIFETKFMFPLTHAQALKLLKDFFENRLIHFGDYQDSITSSISNPVLYHSCISSSMNSGLLTPSQVLSFAKKYRNKVSFNQYEGFVRQIFGWREYMRYCYLYHYNDIIKSNHFNNKEKLPLSWYSKDANTGIQPIDDCIKKAYTNCYLHHIERLMIILNYMTLCEIQPSDIYKWFMTCVSIDAYDWVMVSNIYIFGYIFNKASRKPYISSSAYILRMSDYKKSEWCDKWDNLYRAFVKKKKDKLRGTVYVMNT